MLYLCGRLVKATETSWNFARRFKMDRNFLGVEQKIFLWMTDLYFYRDRMEDIEGSTIQSYS